MLLHMHTRMHGQTRMCTFFISPLSFFLALPRKVLTQVPNSHPCRTPFPLRRCDNIVTGYGME